VKFSRLHGVLTGPNHCKVAWQLSTHWPARFRKHRLRSSGLWPLWSICTNTETAFDEIVQGRAELAAITSETCEMARDFYLGARTPASPTRARREREGLGGCQIARQLQGPDHCKRDCRKRVSTESEQSHTISWTTSTRPPELFTESERFTAVDRQRSGTEINNAELRPETHLVSGQLGGENPREKCGGLMGLSSRSVQLASLPTPLLTPAPALLPPLFWWSRSRECPRASRYRRPKNVDWTLHRVHRGLLTASRSCRVRKGNAVAGLPAASVFAWGWQPGGEWRLRSRRHVRLRWWHGTVIGRWMLPSASEARNRLGALGPLRAHKGPTKVLLLPSF
jgi:hypothetical protein